jgi:hypothetical protein
MEKLSTEQQSSLKKMASERIKEKLLAKGYSPEKVEAMDRGQLLQAMAQVMAAAPDPVVGEEQLGAVGGVETVAATGPPVMGGLTDEQFSMWMQGERLKIAMGERERGEKAGVLKGERGKEAGE